MSTSTPLKRLRVTFERADANDSTSHESNNNNNNNNNNENDPIIDSWYADPYDRPHGAGPTEDLQRRINLENAMRSRGFAAHRIKQVIDWLITCNGWYTDFETGRERRARKKKEKKKKKKKKKKHNVKGKREDVNAIEAEIENKNELERRQKNEDEHEHQSEPEIENEKDDEQSFEEDVVNATTKVNDVLDIVSEHLNSPSPQTADQSPRPSTLTTLKHKRTFPLEAAKARLESTNKTNDDEEYDRLLVRQRFWDIIYGDTVLPLPPPDAVFDYLRGPVPLLLRKKWQSSLEGGEAGEVDYHDEEDDEYEYDNGGDVEVKITKAATTDQKLPDWAKRALVEGKRFSNGFRERWREIAAKRESEG